MKSVFLFISFLILIIGLFSPSFTTDTCFNESCNYTTIISPLYKISPYGLQLSFNNLIVGLSVIYILYFFIKANNKITNQLFWIAFIFLTYVASLPLITYLGFWKFLYPAGIIIIVTSFISIRKTIKINGQNAFESKNLEIQKRGRTIWILLFSLILLPWIIFYGLFIFLRYIEPNPAAFLISTASHLNFGFYLLLLALLLILYCKFKKLSFRGSPS